MGYVCRSIAFILSTMILKDSAKSAYACRIAFQNHKKDRMRHFVTFRSTPSFMEQVQDAIRKVQISSKIAINDNNNILDLPAVDREAVAVASRLSKRFTSLAKNNDCPNCWMQRAHCICSQIKSIEHLLPSNLDRVFLILHHKEMGLAVDTAKLLLISMPTKARLVINGIGEEFQDSMQELRDAIACNGNDGSKRECIVLFPSDDASTFSDLILFDDEGAKKHDEKTMYDVIIIDGTWQQARKIHQRYIPSVKEGGPRRVCLSQEALDILGGATSSKVVEEEKGTGRQLRRHPIQWKEVSTLEATRLLFRDMIQVENGYPDTTQKGTVPEGEKCYDLLRKFQVLSDGAALRQLGPPRSKARTKHDTFYAFKAPRSDHDNTSSHSTL